MSYTILHVADPHFSHCLFLHSDPVQVGRHYANELKQQLKRYRLPESFDAAILSGDFTFACREQGFEAAVQFIKEIAPIIGIRGILVIPGNHDVNLGKPVLIGGKLSLAVSKSEAEAGFRERFLARISDYVGEPRPNLSMVLRVENAGERRGLVIAGLNSSRVERWDAQGWGYVGMDQIWDLGEALLNPPGDKLGAQPSDAILAVMHHNPLPIWDLGLEVLESVPGRRKFSFMMDTASVLNVLADLGVGALLHGHTHVESFKRVEGYGTGYRRDDPTLILGSGSLGVKGARADAPHHFQVIIIEDDLIRCRDLTALPPVMGSSPEWQLKHKAKIGVMHAFWDPERASEVLEETKRKAFEARWDSRIMQSWAQLRSFAPDGEATRASEVVDEILLQVRGLRPAATRADVVRGIKAIFKRPPSEGEASGWPLEDHLVRRLSI